MIDGGTRDTNVTTAVNSAERQMFRNLANAYDCSGAAVRRLLARRAHRDLFGDIHPEAVPRNDVDVDAILRGDLDPDGLPNELKMDGDRPAQIPTADGGVATAPTPSSYTPTYTPQDLADGGVELTWSELKDAVETHWGDDLQVHPDRVRPGDDVDVADDDTYDHDDYALRTRKKTVAKILTGILREDGDQVPEKLVDETILEFTSHQISRADQDAGERYKVETYKNLLVDKLEYLIPHPDPLKDVYYTSETAAKEHFGEEVEKTVQILVEQSQWILDPREHAQREQVNPKDDPWEWVHDLASFRQRLGFLHAVRESKQWSGWLNDLDNDLFDEFPTPQIAVGKTFTEMLNQYLHVNQWARFAAVDAMLEVDDDDVLETTIYDEHDNEVSVNPDRPGQPVMEWVTERDTRLSGPEQIAAVADKL